MSALNKMNNLITKESDISGDAFDLICLSHLRWDFVYQRPQHLISRFAKERRVFYVEEPVIDKGLARFEVKVDAPNLWVVTPHLPPGLSSQATIAEQSEMIDCLMEEYGIGEHVLWYYTPAALAFTQHLQPQAVVYDCMDELSLFKGAPPVLRELEAELFQRADLVFTGGPSLYEAKRVQHDSVHLFPSSIDVAHFNQARSCEEPADQVEIPRPRLGFFGVIDERLDIDLLQGVAEARPDWHLVMVGPVVKIDPASLPQRSNIHYLGMRAYKDLPSYLAGWDVALMPFALNDATRFISPTKTPEYLAGGKPVVSTPIHDVIQLYGKQDLVRIAGTVPQFVAAIETTLKEGVTRPWLDQVDTVLAQNSWDRTWTGMKGLLEAVMKQSDSVHSKLSLTGEKG